MPVNGFDINAFKANYQDLARQYTFMIFINFPNNEMNSDTVKYLVQSSTMPASEIEPIETNWQGHVFPLGSKQTFTDWTVTFKMDDAAKLRRSFLSWHTLIHDPETNIHGSPMDYMVDQEIWNLNPSGDPIMKMKLVNAWPTTIGEVTLDYTANEVQTFDVTWRYLYHIEV